MFEFKARICAHSFLAVTGLAVGVNALTALTPVTPVYAYRGQPQTQMEDAYRAPQTMHGKAVVLPIGTSFEGRIQSTIGSSASKPGERFLISISAPLMANGTDVLIPAGTEITGEVVEAIASSKQDREKGFPRPLGKLRVQLMSLQMPSGVTLPLVASLSGEVSSHQRSGGGGLTSRKSSVAYVGSQAGFDAVNPALRTQRDPRTGKISVLKKDDLLKDPILGDDSRDKGDGQGKLVRSLVKHGRDLYIYAGSPMTIRLDSPLKLTFGASNAQTSIDSSGSSGITAPSQSSGGKRFAKERPAPPPEPELTPDSAQGSIQSPSSGSSKGSGKSGSVGPGSDF